MYINNICCYTHRIRLSINPSGNSPLSHWKATCVHPIELVLNDYCMRVPISAQFHYPRHIMDHYVTVCDGDIVEPFHWSMEEAGTGNEELRLYKMYTL